MANPPRDDNPIPEWRLRPDHTPDPAPVPETTRRTPLTKAQIDEALKEFLNTENFTATRRVLERNQSILLNLETLRRLLELLEREERRERRQMLRIHAELLLLARDRSIDEAWHWLESYLKEIQREAQEMERTMLSAMTPEERRQFDQIMEQLRQDHLSDGQRTTLEEQAKALAAKVAQRLASNNANTPANHDKSALQQGWRVAMQDYVTASDWPARFAYLRQHANDLLHTEVIKELQHMAQQTRNTGKPSLALVFDECARVLEDAKARGIDSAERDFQLRQRHSPLQPTLVSEDGVPSSLSNSDDVGLRQTPLGLSPSANASAPTLPAISQEQVEQIRALVHTPGTFEAPIQQTLLAWLGESEAIATVEDIVRALNVTLQRLG
jgi:hypothetical protein